MKVQVIQSGDHPTFQEFAEIHDFTLVVKEFTDEQSYPYYQANFLNVQVSEVEDATLFHTLAFGGFGPTPEIAILNFANKIEGRVLLEKGTHIQCPKSFTSEEVSDMISKLKGG